MDQHEVEALSGAFRDVHNRLRHLTRPVLESLGLSGPRLSIMMILKHHKQLRVSELQEKLQVAMSTVTQMSDSLEKAGYIVRTRNPRDRREVFMSLSDGGRDVLEQLHGSHFDYLRSALQVLKTDERKRLLEYLNKIAQNLKETDE